MWTLNDSHQRPHGILYRAVQALTAIMALACLVCGYLGLRAIVWRHESELAVMLTSGLMIAGVVGGILGAAYLVLGAHGIRFILSFNWMSVQVGMVAAMLMYGIYNALFPIMPTYATESAAMRALQGAVDGALIGAFVGGLTAFVSGRPVILSFAGLVRYGAIFLLVLGALSIAIFIGAQPTIPGNVTAWLIIPFMLALRVMVGIYDRYQAARTPVSQEEAGDYSGYYEEPV
jgi:hypothetical protein